MIKVLVVDDSPVARDLLIHVLGADPGIQVVGSASNGEEALKAVMQKKPDVITMDIIMPRMNGFEATRLIMETCPTPIVIVSGILDAEESASFSAIEAGALAVIQRPSGFGHPEHEATVKELVQTIKLMSEVKVVRRWNNARKVKPSALVSSLAAANHEGKPREIKLVAIGASTGGPVVLQKILSGLPKDYPLPVLIVQHISAGFVGGFAEWLAISSGFPTSVATQGEHFLSGRAYVAPDGLQMGVGKDDRIILNNKEAENGMCPSVSYLFRSVTDVFGRSAVGVLLTGMGKDGAYELKLMKEKGAITIAQDEESSVIHGMPGEAINLDAAKYVLPPDEIATLLTRLADEMLNK